MPARPRLPLPFPRSGETPQVPGGRRDEQDEGEAQGELAHPAQPGCGPRETQQRKTSKSLRLAGRRRPVPSSALPPVSVSFPCRRRRCRLPGLPPLLTARGRESQALSSCLISYVLVIFSCPSFCSPLGRSLSAAAAAAAAAAQIRAAAVGRATERVTFRRRERARRPGSAERRRRRHEQLGRRRDREALCGRS